MNHPTQPLDNTAHAAVPLDAQADWAESLQWNEQGLIPAIVQDVASHRVIMFAWMNRDALRATVDSGHAVYWSRSRQALWAKGEQSGHRQRIHEIRLDCDADALLLIVEQMGGIACHTGRERCFYRQLLPSKGQQTPAWHDTDPVLKDPTAIYGKNHA